MRRFLPILFVPIIAFGLWSISCQDNVRDILPFRTQDAAISESENLEFPTPDLLIPPDMSSLPDLSGSTDGPTDGGTDGGG